MKIKYPHTLPYPPYMNEYELDCIYRVTFSFLFYFILNKSTEEKLVHFVRLF